MTEATRALAAAARELTPTERLELVEQILDSLDVADLAIDALWAKETKDRLAAYRRGEIRAIPLSEVLTKYQRS